MLFVSTPPGEPSAGFIKMNEALAEDEARIRQRVREGYLVRTRSDIPTAEARSGSTLRRDGAFRSGAQYVTTDYPEPSPFGSGYIARLPGAEQRPARCNPVNAPAGCRDEWLEPGAQAATGLPAVGRRSRRASRSLRRTAREHVDGFPQRHRQRHRGDRARPPRHSGRRGRGASRRDRGSHHERRGSSDAADAARG